MTLEPRGSAGWWASKVAAVSPVAGLGPDEIQELAAEQGGVLPRAYVGFLASCGRACGDVLLGTDAFYPSLVGLRRDAESILAEDGAPFRLGDDDFVVAIHQGYIVLFMRGGDSDPPVFGWAIGEASPAQAAGSFTDFVLGML